jgi:hypothetical protein
VRLFVDYPVLAAFAATAGAGEYEKGCRVELDEY